LPSSVAIDASTLLPILTYTTNVEGGRLALGLSTRSPTNASVTLATLSISDNSSWLIVAPADTPVIYPPYLPSDLATAVDAETYVRDVLVCDIPQLTDAGSRVDTDNTITD
jgi:hypothetical protein